MMKTISHAEKMFLSHVVSLSEKRGYCYATNKHFRDFSNYSERQVERILKHLRELKLIEIKKVDGLRLLFPHVGNADNLATLPTEVDISSDILSVQPDNLTTIESKERVKEEDTSSPSRSITSARKPSQSEPIIARLNERAHTAFKAASVATQRLIRARENEGFGLDDFFTVIDFKCSQWASDEKMLQYLRPSTLFSPKFEGYLQAAKNAKVVKEDEKRKRTEQRDARAPQGRF